MSDTIIRRVVVTVAFLFLVVTPCAMAQKNQSGIPVDVTFAYGDSITGDVFVQDPSTGTYIPQPYSDTFDNVLAQITYGNFYLDTNERKGDGGRRVHIQFPAGFCNGWTASIPCPSDGDQDVYVATVNVQTAPGDLAALSAGQSLTKRFAITWSESGYTYHLRHNGGTDEGDSRGHGNVRFTCETNGSDGRCAQWSASPTGLVGLYGNMIRKGSGEAYLATVSLPFQMYLQKK